MATKPAGAANRNFLWASGGTQSDPGSGIEARGFILSKLLPPGWLNWAIGVLSKWSNYFEDITDEHETDISALEASQAAQDTLIAKFDRIARLRTWFVAEGLEAESVSAATKTGVTLPNNSTIIVAGTGGLVLHNANMGLESDDWDVASSPDANATYLGAAQNGSHYVLVGSDALLSGDAYIVRASVSTPTTLAAQTPDTTPSNAGFYDVTWGAGVFVAVGEDGIIQTSTAGATWTNRTPAGGYSDDFYSVAFGDGVFVIVGQNGEIQTSPDGITWTKRTFPSGVITAADDLLKVRYGNGVFVAAGSLENGSNQLYVVWSADGVSGWTAAAVDLPPGTSGGGTCTMLHFNGTEFLGFFSQNGHKTLQASSDGQLWDKVCAFDLDGNQGFDGALTNRDVTFIFGGTKARFNVNA